MTKKNTENTKNHTPAEIKKIIVKALKDNKAANVSALNIKKLTDIAEYMIIATANSTVHAKALIEKTRAELAAIHRKPISVEGENAREWMLIDFGDIIVHIMLEQTRGFYDLESLWGTVKSKIPTI